MWPNCALRNSFFNSQLTRKMKKVYINDAGPEVSGSIYGFWRWTEADLADDVKFDDRLGHLKDLGINFLDLGSNHHEILEVKLGNQLNKGDLRRDQFVLSTKVGKRLYTNSRREGFVIDFSPKNIQQSIEAKLKRLNTDYLDVILLEEMDFLHDFEKTASALLKMQRAGKVRHFGVSNFNVFQQRQLSNALGQPLIANQLELNLLETTPLHDGRIDFIKEQFSRPIAQAPLAEGRIMNGQDNTAIHLRKALQELAEVYQANVEQVAVAWLQKLGALPLIGSLDKYRIQNAATAYRIDLTHDDWYYLLQNT